MSNDAPEGSSEAERAEDAPASGSADELENLVGDYIDRFNQGEAVDPESILRAHPRLGPEIIEELRAFLELDSGGAPAAYIQKLGEFRLLRQIGRGGMGVVYEAWQESMDRAVAVKVLPSRAADGKAYRRFVREARAAGKLHHENIVTVYGTGLAEGTAYYAMEFIDGETLAQVLTRLGLAETDRSSTEEMSQALLALLALFPGDASQLETTSATLRGPAPGAARVERLYREYARALARAFTAAAEGLQHAHEQGIIHRDLKPSNLIRDRRGSLRVLDFGLARLEGEQSITLSGDFVGTPLYMSPEQAHRDRLRVDHHTDIYSLGVTLYQMLAWKPPLAGKNVQDTLRQILECDPEPIRPDVPRDLETIIFKCLRKTPETRYASAAALAKDLRRFVAGEPIEARPRSRGKRAAHKLWRHRRWLLPVAAALAVVAFFSMSGGIPEGSTNVKVWEIPGHLRAVDMSRDARTVLLHMWGGGDIALHDLETGETRRLLDLAGNEDWHLGGTEAAVLSRDGTKVAYTWRGETDQCSLRVVHTDGSGVEVLRSGVYALSRDWSSDDESILAQFWGTHEIDGESYQAPLVLIPADGDGPTELVTERRRIVNARFSPDADARFVAYTTGEGRRGHEIHLFDRWLKTDTLVAGGEPHACRLEAWLPDGRGILFASDRSGFSQLWALRIEEGAPAKESTPLLPWAERTVIGVKDRSLYVTMDRSHSTFRIAPIGADDRLGEDRVILRGSRFGDRIFQAEWSPQGDRLAYRVNDLNAGHWGPSDWGLAIYRFDDDREQVLQVKPPLPLATRVRGPRWSPDGRHLLIWVQDEGLCLVEIESGKRSLLLEKARMPRKGGAARAVFSRSGDAVYFVTTGSLSRYDRESGAITPLVLEAGGLLDISPDGSRLAFLTAPATIEWIPVEGGEPQEVVKLRELTFFLRWSPGGEHILFSRERELWRVAVDGGGEEEKIGDFTGDLAHLSVHPRGGKVTISTEHPASELWRFTGIFEEMDP